MSIHGVARTHFGPTYKPVKTILAHFTTETAWAEMTSGQKTVKIHSITGKFVGFTLVFTDFGPTLRHSKSISKRQEGTTAIEKFSNVFCMFSKHCRWAEVSPWPASTRTV